ncbi:helix-turn-helix domain-containing protein [Actinomadura adrarensis]|uniref:Helix-turn-helix domain-containing protein n=1 Tax=Actinomadura adrarensis TaxID=1819600 RepID=A0ABW3CBB0_9ACTN
MSKTFRNQRLRRGWTQRDLAAEVERQGLSKPSDSNLSLYERGKVVPRPQLRAVLCELLDLPIDYFDETAEGERAAS